MRMRLTTCDCRGALDERNVSVFWAFTLWAFTALKQFMVIPRGYGLVGALGASAYSRSIQGKCAWGRGTGGLKAFAGNWLNIGLRPIVPN